MSNIKELRQLQISLYSWVLEWGFYSTRELLKLRSLRESGYSWIEVCRKLGKPSSKKIDQAEEEIGRADELGIQVICIAEDNYPDLLREIVDPPLVLFLSSRAGLSAAEWQNSEFWAIIGSRNATCYGLASAKELASLFAERGLGVISGLAYGIDCAAHQGALKGAQGNSVRSSSNRGSKCGEISLPTGTPPTIAVLGSGLLEVYPKANRRLAMEIISEGGVLISEYGLYAPPRAHHFPRRNRIISGLSLGVVVVEAREKSGSLITARLALEQNRDVFTIPGPIDSSQFAGSNRLLADGAGVITSISDFVREIAPTLVACAEQNQMTQEFDLAIKTEESSTELELLIPSEGIEEDLLAKKYPGTFGSFQKELLDLELSNRIIKDEGMIFRHGL